MTKQEKEDWNNLYEFVRVKVMEYDSNQSLSKNMVLRLKGLSNNKYMANNNIESTANYSYITILNTFKYCMPDIQKNFHTKSFNDEMHKFNYALAIVESNINNVYIRMKHAEKVKEEIKNVDTEKIAKFQMEYTQRKKRKRNTKLDDMW
jgi:hypothetical protein